MKVVIMTYVLLTGQSSYLVTLGDAAASFLEHRDPGTTGKCLFGREELLLNMGRARSHPISDLTEQDESNLRLGGVWLPCTRQHFFSVHRATLMILTQV